MWTLQIHLLKGIFFYISILNFQKMVRSILLVLAVFLLSVNGFCRQVFDKHTLELDRLFNQMGEHYEMVKDTQYLIHFVDSIRKENNVEKTEYAMFSALFLRYFSSTGIFADVQSYISQAPVYAGFNTPMVKSVYKYYLGDIYFVRKEYSKGMDLMLEAVKECEDIGSNKVPLMGRMLYNLCNYYYNFSNYRQAIHIATQGLKCGNKKVLYGLLNTIGMSYQKLEKYDSAVLYFKQSLKEAQSIGLAVWVSIASGNLGRTYCLQKNYVPGLQLLRHDMEDNKKEEPVNSAISALYIAEVFNDQHLPDSAQYYINVANHLFTGRWQLNKEKMSESLFGYYYYKQLSRYNEEKRDYHSALKYSDTANTFKEKYKAQYDWRLLTSAEKRIDGLEYQKSLAVLAAEKKNEQLQKLILFIVLAAVFVITILVISRQRLKLKKERQLAAQKEANLLLQQQQAQQELDSARLQLDEFVQNIQDKNSLLDKITAELTTLSNKKIVKEEKDTLTDALHELKNTTLLTNDDWYRFQERFEKVYKGFFTRLSMDVPGITPAEERLLALAKLNINSRQMGMMLGISPASVRTARYRLRKKLLLSKDDSIILLLDSENDVEYV